MQPSATYVATLPPHSLFHDVPASDLERLMAASHPMRLRAGNHVFVQHEPAENVYLVLSGSVKLYRDRPDGNVVVLTICGGGEVLGDADAMSLAPYGCSALALEHVDLRSMARDDCLRCLQTMPTLTFNTARHALLRLRAQADRFEALTSNDIPGRLAWQIMHFADRYGTTDPNGDIFIPLRLTQSDLADMVGASRSRVNETMALWKRNGHLSADSQRRITVHHAEVLHHRCRR